MGKGNTKIYLNHFGFSEFVVNWVFEVIFQKNTFCGSQLHFQETLESPIIPLPKCIPVEGNISNSQISFPVFVRRMLSEIIFLYSHIPATKKLLICCMNSCLSRRSRGLFLWLITAAMPSPNCDRPEKCEQTQNSRYLVSQRSFFKNYFGIISFPVFLSKFQKMLVVKMTLYPYFLLNKLRMSFDCCGIPGIPLGYGTVSGL